MEGSWMETTLLHYLKEGAYESEHTYWMEGLFREKKIT
jgi:hypothetical protein